MLRPTRIAIRVTRRLAHQAGFFLASSPGTISAQPNGNFPDVGNGLRATRTGRQPVQRYCILVLNNPLVGMYPPRPWLTWQHGGNRLAKPEAS